MNLPPERAVSIGGNGDEIFRTEDEIQKSMARLQPGDLYMAGKIYIHALRIALVGSGLTLIPVIYAAPKERIPTKPPPMKYKDLPIYESPHYEYKDYIEDAHKCPDYKVKIMHSYLYPNVAKYRQALITSVGGMAKELVQVKKELCDAIDKRKKEYIKYMRDPQNLTIRRAVVGFGTATGFYLGSGTRGITRKLFCSVLGALATGALCFPDETDEIFRNTSYKIAKIAIALYNSTCNKKFALRERLPCREDLPPPPPPIPAAKVNKCEKKN